jgi:hypothetical protein
MILFRKLLLVQISGLLLFETVFANPCPKPKVKIMVEINENSLDMLQDDYGFKTEQGWKNEIASRVEGHLAKNADDFEAYKGPDCADFRLVISITETESFNYWVTSKMYGMGKGYIIDEVQIRKGADLDSLISESVGRFGNIEEMIKAREASHPWPARNPSFEVRVDPEEISPQAGSDSSIISVKVFHCNGKLAKAKQIIYYSTETSRGTVNTYMGTGAESTGGALTAKYKLDYSKGTHPGKDTVKIWTEGYCSRKYTTEAVIKIKPRDGILEIEKTSGELGICNFENRCVVQIPFEMIESKDSENYEIKGGESNRISYKEKCQGCNEITGTFWARITGGMLDMERNPKNPLSLSFEILRDNEVHTITCRQPPLVMPRDKQAQMSMKLRNWPLIDGYSEQIGVFKYTLHLGRKSD